MRCILCFMRKQSLTCVTTYKGIYRVGDKNQAISQAFFSAARLEVGMFHNRKRKPLFSMNFTGQHCPRDLLVTGLDDVVLQRNMLL